jgi:hypothetical protein
MSEIYKNIRVNFENVHCLDPTVPTHQPPNMIKTLERLAVHMEKSETNVFKPNRPHSHVPPLLNVMSDGAAKCEKGTKLEDDGDDEEMEVEDGGDLSAL